MAVIQRDFLPSDLKPLLQANGLDACVAVQADQSESETHFLLDLAQKHDFIAGVVGWVDLCSPSITERLAYWAQFPLVKGFRHIVQAEPMDFLLQPAFVEGVRQLANYHFTYDLLIKPPQLTEAVAFVQQLPENLFVIDHLAKPDFRSDTFAAWAKGMRQLAAFPHVHCKISGMVTEADWKHWQKDDFVPHLELLLEVFGEDRLLFGSDWPVCLLAASYAQVCEVVQAYVQTLTPAAQAAIWGHNAQRFYNLDHIYAA